MKMCEVLKMALQIAVLSTSRIVAEVMREIGNWPEVEVTAIVCRPQSAEKAHAWVAEYGVPAVYTDEAAAYAAGGFDAVYIGTANHLHYAAAKRALQAGYHVLLEKPFTATAAEARELFALADAKGLVLMEAITIPYLPQYAFLQAELPKIGEVRGAMASFCARSARYDDYLKGIWNTTFDPACLGGALNDMNVYNLHLLCGLLGVPGRAEYRPSCGPNGIDTAGLALLDYGGRAATAWFCKGRAVTWWWRAAPTPCPWCTVYWAACAAAAPAWTAPSRNATVWPMNLRSLHGSLRKKTRMPRLQPGCAPCG